MLSLEDCVALCGLTDDEVQLVADHEHVPTIVAAELASELMKSRRGICRLKGMMLDALERAKLTNPGSARGRSTTYIWRSTPASPPRGCSREALNKSPNSQT
ncbi:MAG: hypothetical protein ABWY07_12780 [Burkholderiales bacterium]